MMKRINVILIFLVFFLGACQLMDLPPTSGIPGSSASPFGKAVDVYDLGYSEPTTLSVSTKEIVFTSGQSEEQLFETSVTGEQYVYKIGYVLNVSDISNPRWVQFTFDQPTMEFSNWIKGDADMQLRIKLSNLNINVGEKKNLYLIAYACTKMDGAWNCHQNKWMIKNITTKLIATEAAEITENGTAPAAEITNATNETVVIPACTDSDVIAEFADGKNYNLKGVITYSGPNISDIGDVIEDSCTNINILKEYFCEQIAGYDFESYRCLNGCIGGACSLEPRAVGICNPALAAFVPGLNKAFENSNERSNLDSLCESWLNQN